MVQKKSLIWSVIGKLSKWREKVTSHAQNLHLKLKQLAPSFESILAVWLKKPFFKNNTFLFFYIESSSFQHLIEFCETFQNFNSFSLFRQLLFSFFFYWWSDWVEILYISNRLWKFHFSILKNKKVLFLKYFFKLLSISKQKGFVYDPIFNEGFAMPSLKVLRWIKHSSKTSLDTSLINFKQVESN